MAIESPKVTADVVEVQEYPHLAQAYAVRGVPKTVINDRVSFTGAVPEATFVHRLLEAVGAGAAEGSPDESVSGQSTPLD
jgi:predicted DsbA family dithiol-disulfide isomerase